MLIRLWWKIKYRRSPRWLQSNDGRFWSFQPGQLRRFMRWTDPIDIPDWSGWTDVGYTEDLVSRKADPPC